jgi:hypothetical protein|tara:strand:- start:66 stop:692 length:627 start_codon:yes stop_codon:yes gene_type:complete
MATTKKQLAEQIIRILNSGDVTNDNSIDPRELLLAIEQERDRLVRLRLFESMNQGEGGIPGDVVSTFDNITIKKDTTKDLLYSSLPGRVMSLPKDMGILHVSYTKDQYNAFIRMPNGSLSLYNGLLSSAIGGRGGYWLEGDRIYYNSSVDDCCGNTVIIKMVMNSGDVDPNDIFPIPSDLESEVIRNIIQLYSPMKAAPNDEQNDNIE